MPTKPKRTRKLGKAQERRLHVALSTDDLLYRKFERLNEELQETYARFMANPQRAFQVLGRRADSDLLYSLIILEAHPTQNGTRIIVGLPPDRRKK
jgi:hypothetical protein